MLFDEALEILGVLFSGFAAALARLLDTTGPKPLRFVYKDASQPTHFLHPCLDVPHIFSVELVHPHDEPPLPLFNVYSKHSNVFVTHGVVDMLVKHHSPLLHEVARHHN